MNESMRLFENRDCMEAMKEYPDGHFDLAIVDPPYGILAKCGGGVLARYGDAYKEWDKEPPPKEYWEELFRVSKNQIAFGANNYWKDNLLNTTNFIFWYKHQQMKNFAAGELAWTSFKGPARVFDYPYAGGANREKDRFHPTQKPVALYKWILLNYAQKGWLLLDTHVGSGSSLIAFEDMGYSYAGFELDSGYFRQACERLEKSRDQLKLFDPSTL